MSQPLLSVCVPTYNRPELLERTLRSVTCESDVLEILVTDNSNNSKTEEKVRDVMSDAPCAWRYYRNDFPQDKSNLELMVMNLNRGIELAEGGYIYTIHDDDFLMPGSINMLLHDLRNRAANQAVIKYGVNLVAVDGQVRKTRTCSSKRLLSPRDALLAVLTDSSFARAPSIVFRSDVYEKIGRWSAEADGMDTELFVRAFREFGVLELPEILSCYTIHDQAQTMGNFNDRTIRLLLTMFDKADPAGLLTTKELRKAEALFFHQFILGGTYRFLKNRRLNEAARVMQLFSIDEIAKLPIPIKWLGARLAFRAIVTVANR